MRPDRTDTCKAAPSANVPSTVTPFLLSSVPFGAAGEPSHAANGIAISKHRIIVNIHRVRIFIFLSSRKGVYANAYSGVCVNLFDNASYSDSAIVNVPTRLLANL